MEMNKKGQDTLVIGFLLLFTIIVAYTFITIFSAFGDMDIVKKQNESKQIVADGKSLYQGLDFAVPGILLALNIGSLLAAYFLKSNPIFSILFLIMIPITILIAGATANAYEAIEVSLGLASSFPISHVVMSNLPLILFGLDILGGILLFGIL